MVADDTSPPVALITGASRGLGAGIAEQMANRGWALGLCARTLPRPPSRDRGSRCGQVDVADAASLEGFAAEVESTLGPIDLWINNAGVLAPIGPLRACPVEASTLHVNVNLLGVLNGSRCFARLVHNRQGRATLVNISSGAARSIYEGWSLYGATKAAVDQLSRVLAAEESEHGLRVYAVAPGVVDTDMQAMIRSSTPENFPALERFQELAATGSFNSPAWVADRILELHEATSTGITPTWAAVGEDPVVLRLPDQPRG